MLALLRSCLLLFVLLGVSLHAHADETGPVPFVMQMTVATQMHSAGHSYKYKKSCKTLARRK